MSYQREYFARPSPSLALLVHTIVLNKLPLT